MLEYADRAVRLIKERIPGPARAWVRTFGCDQNESDSEKIRGVLDRLGYSMTDSADDADLVIFNTCAIRENAELKIFGNIGELKAIKASRPGMIIAVCGCMVMQQHIIDKIRKSYPFVDIVFGVNAIDSIPRLIYEHYSRDTRIYMEPDDTRTLSEDLPILRSGKAKASVTIMYGCDNFCSYCIVPYVRGRERSRRPEDILREFRQLVDEGYRDITLLGQNVNSYGKGLDEDIDFSGLLELLCTVEGDYTLRYMSSHPKDFTRKVIDTIRANDRISRHIHLPVQSGNDRILNKMNRRYTTADYMDIIRYARDKIPSVTFSSDIIVGFPTETYEEYLDTEKLVKEVGFTQLFTYIYSRRKGTRAASMDDIVPHSEKAKWLNRLIRVQRDITYTHLDNLKGSVVRVLREEANGSLLTGNTAGSELVRFEGGPEDLNKYILVRITGRKGTTLLGERIQ